MELTGIIIWSVLIIAAVTLLLAIIGGKMTGGGSFSSAAVIAEMQNQEKRNAMETVIGMNTGERNDGISTTEPTHERET